MQFARISFVRSCNVHCRLSSFIINSFSTINSNYLVNNFILIKIVYKLQLCSRFTDKKELQMHLIQYAIDSIQTHNASVYHRHSTPRRAIATAIDFIFYYLSDEILSLHLPQSPVRPSLRSKQLTTMYTAMSKAFLFKIKWP